MKKKANLGSFAETSKVAQASPLAEAPKRRERGTGEFVSATVRMTHEDWRRASQLALDQNTSLQFLFLRGLSEQFKKKGLPPIAGIE